jgi:predicted DNA-binding antitoxin AbrB/MazE fold protein
MKGTKPGVCIMIVDAVFQGGVFKPLSAVKLAENQQVRLQIKPVGAIDVASWFAELDKVHGPILERNGGQPLPDSTADIAEDRLRDV